MDYIGARMAWVPAGSVFFNLPSGELAWRWSSCPTYGGRSWEQLMRVSNYNNLPLCAPERSALRNKQGSVGETAKAPRFYDACACGW